MIKGDITKELENFNIVKNAHASVIAENSTKLYQEYLKSENHKKDVESGTEMTVDGIRELAKSRTRTDWLLAQFAIFQEGKIPPMNSFANREDIIKTSLALQGDKELMIALQNGEAVLCVHASESEIADGIFGALSTLKEKLEGLSRQQINEPDKVNG